jgi:hypothetical protein
VNLLLVAAQLAQRCHVKALLFVLVLKQFKS